MNRPERLTLHGLSWLRYYAPLGLCGFIAGICVALLGAAWFINDLGQAVGISVAGGFGLLMSSALGFTVLVLQRKELNFYTYESAVPAEQAYGRVRGMMSAELWRVVLEEPGCRLEAETAGSLLEQGELVSVRFAGYTVLVASICDPRVGFSLAGMRRCKRHRHAVHHALSGAAASDQEQQL
jgi:hypothetical protein